MRREGCFSQEHHAVRFLHCYAQYFDSGQVIKLGRAPGSSWYHFISAVTTMRHSFVHGKEQILSGEITGTGEKH